MQAEGLAIQLGEAETLASRQSAEIAKYRADLSDVSVRCEAAETANGSLAAQVRSSY